MMRIKILGFINIDWLDHLPEVQGILVDEWKKGNLIIQDGTETVIDTRFADIPQTWMKLFEGGNTGKLITRLIDS
jgi:NADPH-dependent curcumin reductase CurA